MKKCRDCGNNHDGKNKLCDICSKRARDAVNKRRADLTKKGLCIQCGKNKKLDNCTRCETCTNNINKKNKDRVEEYIKANRCWRCGRSNEFVFAWHTTDCAGCHLKFKFSFTGTKEEAEKIINDMLEKQNFKCALTGRDLRTNKFHIDHIIPRSSGGQNDPSNLQLIVDEANVFKTNLSIEQVLMLSKDIVIKAIKDGKLSPSDLES